MNNTNDKTNKMLLWINNDYDLYQAVVSFVEARLDDPAYYISLELGSFLSEYLCVPNDGVMADLIGWDDIDFEFIVEHIVERGDL